MPKRNSKVSDQKSNVVHPNLMPGEDSEAYNADSLSLTQKLRDIRKKARFDFSDPRAILKAINDSIALAKAEGIDGAQFARLTLLAAQTATSLQKQVIIAEKQRKVLDAVEKFQNAKK